MNPQLGLNNLGNESNCDFFFCAIVTILVNHHLLCSIDTKITVIENNCCNCDKLLFTTW